MQEEKAFIKEESLEQIEKAIKFLYEKNAFDEVEDDEVETKLKYLRNPEAATKSKERCKEIQQRALTLVVPQIQTTNELPKLHTFSLAEFQGYSKENVVFLQNQDYFIQFYQNSGLCYMHAPAVALYYARRKCGQRHDTSIIDLLKFVKEVFDGPLIYRHVFHDDGGDSIAFLNLILKQNQEDDTFQTNKISDLIPNYNLYGPALVSRFMVYEEFYSGSRRRVHFHHDVPSKEKRGKYIGLHAMLLVGFRTTTKGNFYLLQNWWGEKQFIEVSGPYLAACKPTFTFITLPQDHELLFPNVQFGRFLELESLDQAEGSMEGRYDYL